MISGVMRFADRSARGLMTPRRDVELIDLDRSARGDPAGSSAARTARVLPVQDGEPDEIVGVLILKDLVELLADGKPLDVRAMMRQAPVVMDRSDALHVLRAIRSSTVHMALVFDEYGHFEGIVTLGRHPRGDHRNVPGGGGRRARLHRARGRQLSRLGAGCRSTSSPTRSACRSRRTPSTRRSPASCSRSWTHLPQVGETFERAPWRFEVLDLDGRRIDKVLVTRTARRLERLQLARRVVEEHPRLGEAPARSCRSVSAPPPRGAAGYRGPRPARPWRASRCARRPGRRR